MDHHEEFDDLANLSVQLRSIQKDNRKLKSQLKISAKFRRRPAVTKAPRPQPKRPSSVATVNKVDLLPRYTPVLIEPQRKPRARSML
jgi:hypothetical protein